MLFYNYIRGVKVFLYNYSYYCMHFFLFSHIKNNYKKIKFIITKCPDIKL